MRQPLPHSPIPRLALRPSEAAAALGISEDYFREIAPELRAVRRGRVRLYPVADLSRWLEEHGERVLEGRAA
jgi:excisionase family DNA binding protein